MVDAIEEGRIVRVSEAYARQEGLMVLRKPKIGYDLSGIAAKKQKEEKEYISMDTFRKPLKNRQSDIVKELKNNFNWDLGAARKRKGMTRKQVADAVHEKEQSIKLLENGVLPSNDFILISKLENYYKINLRKDAALSGMKQAAEEVRGRAVRKKEDTEQAITLDDVEVFE